MEINKWVEVVHKNASDKGWWTDPEPTPLEIAALIHSEVSEFVEEARTGKPPFYWHDEYHNNNNQQGELVVSFHHKPEGQMIELADVVLRVMDYFGKKGWNLEQAIEMKHNYNKTRAIRHGGKIR